MISRLPRRLFTGPECHKYPPHAAGALQANATPASVLPQPRPTIRYRAACNPTQGVVFRKIPVTCPKILTQFVDFLMRAIILKGRLARRSVIPVEETVGDRAVVITVERLFDSIFGRKSSGA